MFNFAVMMEQGNGCALFNAVKDGVLRYTKKLLGKSPTEYRKN